MRGTVCVQAAAHRGTVCTFVRQKYQKRGGFRNAPSTSEGSALRKPRAKQGNRFLAYPLPSTARRRTPARCRTRCLACAPTTKARRGIGPGGLSKICCQKCKPIPPSEESGENPPRAGGGEGGHLPVPLAFFASFWQKKEGSPFLYALLSEQMPWLVFAPAPS